ncbi:LPD38 domain-containing protein [uncultured Prevotella sp.]|uniref:LPD38 domain-containing protein n=1 Tax=uncultured Prevotella sp. TaxID=159272 RepID=UPI0027E3756B|nr:LPD38 domain-containing protein [uncultured Prevotella sp.]
MADNRYYYFKDAKGNRHTVDKTAYDKDPMGFAKAFPGARMEVIDRKTGRRGDVSVKDASRVGDFGAHLFTGRTITRGKVKGKSEKSYSSALGRAQERVAQEKWGGESEESDSFAMGGKPLNRGAAAPSVPVGKESELVKGLREADALKRRDEEQMPIDYTKPGAVKQMVGGARRAQKSLERRMEQAGQEAGRNAEGEIRRRNAPAFDLGNENVNNNLVKTRGQLEKEMEESAATIADKNFADTFANMIAGERQAAEKRGFDAYLQRTMFSATPMGSTLLGTIAYNAERDPAKLQQNLLNSLGENMESMLSDPNVAQKVVTESKRLGVDPEDYVKTALMPSIQNKLMSEYDKTELKEWMPRNAFVDIIDGLGDGFQVGSILDAALTKAQRQYRQRAIMATQNGENPYYQRDKYGVTEGVRSALSLASDVIGPGGGVLGGIGKGVGAASAKVFGNEVKTIARMANMSKLQRMFKPSILMRGAAETGANFGIYEGLKGAQSYSSTTDDVKLGEMLENSAVSAAHGAVSGATLGVVGKMLGGLGYNVGIKGPMGVDPNFGKNMLKGLGMKGVQIIGEGTAFYAGGNFNNALSGADTDWSAGNLLSNIMAAGIYKIVSTHTATGAANMLTPEKGQSYGGSVAVKFGTALYKAAMAPSAQGKAFAFTPDEKQQLFASGDKAGLPGKEGSFGRQDILTWAERVMKATPVGKEDKSGNVKVAREYYESVMQDPNVSWDAKMKLNALLGIAPATRPEMDMRTYTIEDGKRYVNEYAKDGTLLSKRSYKNMEQREAIEYDLMMQKENQRMLNGLGYILNRDCSRMDLQMEFLRQHDYDFDNPDSPRNQAIMDDMLGNNKTLTLKRGRTLHDEWLDFVSENGITTKLIKDIADAHGLSVEEMFKIVNKEPIKRTEEEQRACVELRKALNNIVYEDGMPHADQADSDGKDVVEENNLGTENPNNEAVAEVLNNMNNAEKAFNAALESNDVLKQEYERLTKEGLSEPQIYMELINSGVTQEQLAPFADYINAKAKASGMYRGTKQKIAETVQKHVDQWSYKGELNGEKQEGGQILFVKDNNGRLLIIGAGDVAFDSEGRARESVGDMLSVLDPNTKEMDFVSKKDVQLDHVEKTEDYAKNYQTMLEEKNSVAYAESEKGKEKSEESDGGSEELRVKSEESNGNVDNESSESHSYTLSEKKAGNGEQFYQDESGNIDLATIPDEIFEGIGYTKAPFRLTPSMIRHMLDRHNKELGFKDEGEAINFVVDVMNNFDHVRLGYDGALVFSIENGRKRTGKRAVTVLINSDNGEFYGLKTSGYEGIKGLEKRPLLWERGANESSSTDAASASVTTGKGSISGEQSGSASHQSNGLHGKDSNNSPYGNGGSETLTFADGSPVPMMKDTKGRETADYSQMTPEQGAEWMSSQFGENAEAAVDGQINRAEKMLKEAEKIKVDYTGDLNDAKEAEAQKAKAVDAAKAELELYTNIKKVMTANKVKAGMEKVGSAGEEGSVGSVGEVSVAVREKFEKSKKIPGRRGSITLPDGTKITGQYFYGEVSGLTPSHDPFNDFKQNEGFPVNEDGSSSNSRSYKDKESRLFTEKIGRDFGGQALKNVPVVQDGILLSGNGTTMGKQLAERYGTDGKYYESLSENAEGFGWTPKQIEEAGFKGTVYFVPDKKMPLTSKTFDLFNKQETKSIGNTEQSVKNAKVLSTDEVGAIIAEIEGSGSLDAFFNNPTAINSLLKRLIDKGVIGLNEVAGLREGEDKLSAAGKDFVKNLLLGSVFSENTIRMMGVDAMLKTKALNGIRAVTDNMKLGDYALMKEIDQAVQLLYEARQGGSGVDAYLRTPAMFGENAADRYDPISQAIALALEGKVEDFRELMMAYNRNAASYADANQTEMFGERPTKEDFVKEFLKFRNWKDYETRHSSKEGNGDVGGSEGGEPETSGGNGRRRKEGLAKSEEGRVKSEESDSKVEGVVTPKGDIKDATAPKGDKTKEEPSKTNPLAWLAHTAEMFKDEQIQKAREELTAAKESGDASDIKRATEKMKQAMETKLRGNGIGLVERRRIIGRELGKILDKEAGKAEAEKVNKPWEQMDLEEREAVSSKNPLTETEINELTSEENRELIPAALAYLRGDKGNIINAISYFKIWNDVRSRHENVPDNSGTKDGTQLDAPNTGGSQELGLGRGREGGGPDGPVDRTDGERTTPGERESGTGGENDTPVSTGKPRVDKGEGNTPGMDAVSAGSTDTRGGGGAGNEGNVPKRGGQGGGNGPLDPNAGRKPAAKQGTHFPDSTSERLKQERAEYEQKKKDFWERWKKAGQGYVKIALTPFKKLNLSPEQIEMLPELFKMHLNGAVLKIKEGIYKFNEWKAAMRAEEGEELKMIGLSDDDIDRFIEDYWNTPYQMDGETHTIGEWAGIHGNENLRNKLSEPLNEKYQRQVDAEPIKVKVGDMKNIEETLPYLLPQQQEDVLKAETQFFGKEHTDREHAYGKGYMFTNGTGTGKTFTGLGIAKRLVKQGKGRILIVTPSQKKVSDWIKDGRNLNMEIRDLDSIAKERGTTATTESGEGVVITTFANFGVNKKLLEENWDAVIYDESHRIMENKKGAETARSMQHYMVTNRDENHCFLRLQEINKDYQKQKSLGEQFDIERAKETERIRKEYKASHPSATERDVAYATSRMVPRDVYNFTPSDYVTFPVLGKIHAEYVKALSHYTNEVKPKLEAQAKTEWKDTKTIFLSATPFNTRENLDYVEGYIFKYPKVENSGRMSGRTQFCLDHFGAAYKFRYNRLEQSTSNPEAVAKQEIEFSDYLQHTLGTMSGRIIDSPYDYSRDFPTVSPDHAERFNQAVQEAIGGHGVLADAYRKTIGDYTYGSALFETMKVANIIERIKAHLDAGRKVVIFHRRVESKEPLKPPFALMLDRANFSISLMNPGEEKNEAIQAVRAFRKKYADLLKWEQTLDYSMPREQIAKVFGKDNVLFFSGKESTKVKDKAVDTFNDDNSGKNIIVIQEASGKEGISLHDKTGEHQRVCITLALPQSPITALQIEGRTYRIGNKSNAIFEYPILGLNSEMMLFGQKFNNQVSTTENLALGSQARSLRDSFANGILEHSGVVPIDQQGVGGKEFDAPKDQSTDGFDNAVLDYYSNQKLNSRNREGVDYFPTPEPLGYKMMEWANMGEGDTVMEPSAGHGAIARYAPKGNQMVAIEPSQSLFAKLQLKAGGLGRKFVNTIFENYDISNKHDVVVMNPPFGTAGATAIAHLGKAFKHLEEGGRVVALIPRGSTDKKFDKWIEGEKTAVMRAEVELPDIVFKQAGTNVVCRVVVVDKISNEAMRAKAGRVEKVSLGGHYDKIEDFFEDLRDIEMPDRIIDTNTIMQKKSKQTAKDLKELKDVTVNLNEHGINVHVRGDRNDYSIMFDLGEYNAEQRKSILSGTYERFEEYERYTRDETSQAVIAELKKLTCKLTGMTEEEMQRYLKKQNDGKGVMYRMEHAAEVYGKANAHYRMELGNTFSDSKEHFDAVRDRAVEEKGIVMPNLNKEKVKVVEVEKHLFGENKADAIKNARTWAKDNLATKNGDMPTMRDGTPYIISKAAIDKYLSNSAISKSDDPFVHLSVLKKLTDVIHESIEAEIHADYKKGEDGMRSVENGYGEGVLVHRLYGAVEIDGKMYRVKTTMQEFRGGEENKPHSYEVTKIELLDSPGKRENPDRPPLVSSNNSIDTAKLLQGVEKSYDSGKKLLDESKNLTDGETFFRKEGDGVVTPEKTSGTSNAVSERIIKTVEKVAKRTGGKVKMVNSVEEIENPMVRKDIEKGKQVTGWYDEKTGEVHLYMPNIHDSYTAEKTVWHETVGHKGMRGLLGDKFNDYMRSLWMDLDNPINAELRAYVKEKMNMNHLGFYDAIEEFIAKSAEDGKGEPGFWNYIKNKVTDALHEIGYRVSPNVKDVKYMLWLAKNVQKHGDSPLWKMRAEAVRWKIEHEKTLSVVEENGMMYDNNGKKHGLLDLNKKDFDEATDGHVHYRTSPMTASKIEEYNRRLSTKWYAFKESTVDDMQSLQEAMQIISGVKDAYTDIPSAFNPLQCHNRMGSMVMQMCERYDREYTEPLGNAFKKVVSAMPGKDGAEQTRNANLYFIKKHGLERNRVLFVRDKIREERKVKSEESDSIDALETAWKDERSDLRQKLDSGQIDLKEYYRQMDEWIVQNLDKDFKAEEHDYSGMHGIYDVKKGEEYDDANVIDEVMSTESQLGADLVKSFWDAKKKATDFTIDQVYANGFKDKNERDHLKEMFDWYVPLRKFDDTVAEDVYGYISGGDTKNGIGSVIEKARGRESLSDVNVLAQISALAKSSILNGGKNVEKQHFMRFVEAYEKGDAKDRIFVEIQPWVEKHTVDGNEVWEEVMPNIPENSTQEQINDILNTFEADMKAKQANGEAKVAKMKSDIGYKFERSSDMNQHIVNVYVNGRVRRFVCQGNPRAAQAINGLLRDSGTQHWATEQSAKLNRICAQLNTSLNPDFVSSNLVRDLTAGSANLVAKEGMGYTWDFCMEYAKNWGSMVRRKDGRFDGGYLGMFRRYKEGRLDANNQKERWFKEFMDNGGETGFVSLKKYEDIIKEYDNLVKTGNKEGDRWLMKKLKEGGAFIELANEVVENVARYSTYCVSRKRGRSIGKSIYDAKEVSSNFNRHGSGDAIKSLKTEYDGKTDAKFRKSVGWFNSWMKNHTMFYNAGVQGANLFAKNLYNNTKTTAIAFGAMPFGLSLAVALFNLWRIGREDEKKRNGVKNPYAELPEWKRRNNLCIYLGGGDFKTIPMGIELRAFYGLGDIAAGYVVDESLKSDVQIGWDIIGQMAQLVPASDFLGHHSPSSGIKELVEDALLSATPTIAKPGFELAFNRDWTGRPIYRDNDYLDKAPRWKRAYDSTNDAYMTINKWANKTFNGIDSTNEDLKGSGMMADAVDFFTAPYGLQHIVEGYTGGTGATIGRMYQTGKSFAKGVVSGIKDDKGFAEGFNKEWDKVNPNDIPFYRVFNYTPKEGNDMQRTKSKWYNYADELEQLKYNMQQMKTNTPDTAKNIHNAAFKFKFSQSKDGRKLQIYDAADRYITAKRRILERAKDKTVVEAVNAAINRKMQEAVEELDKIE